MGQGQLVYLLLHIGLIANSVYIWKTEGIIWETNCNFPSNREKFTVGTNWVITVEAGLVILFWILHRWSTPL